MFENILAEKFKRIFDIAKVTYRKISASEEQSCLFIEVDEAKTRLKHGRFVGQVKGKIKVFAELEKLPLGYFMQRLSKASPDDLSDLYFYNFEENAGTIDNVIERTLRFIYLFNFQYDPDVGEITSITTTVTVG